jgi:PKD repeat protein
MVESGHRPFRRHLGVIPEHLNRGIDVVEETGHRLVGVLAVFLCASILTCAFVLVPGDSSAFPETAASEMAHSLDSGGISNSDNVSVTADTAPVANAGPDQVVNVGSTVTFDGSGSTDDIDPLALLNLTWTFTYNSLTQTLYDVNPTFEFLISGTYSVTLTVTDTGGQFSTDMMVVTVNAPPTAAAGPDQTVNQGSMVSFDGSASADDLDGLTQLNLTWTFTSSGSPVILWGISPTFQFDVPGIYVVTLTVIDTGGLSDTDAVTINVSAPPIADAGPDQFVNSVAAVTFNASGTTDDFDSLASLNFTWNFTYGGGPVIMYGLTPTFTFVEGGVYIVTLTVRDSGGLTDVDYVVISVNLAPTANAGPDLDVNIDGTVNFDASASTDDTDPLATLNFTWSFAYGGSARNLWGVSPSFQFSEIGSYIVTLTVTDSRGVSSTDSMLVSVNGPPTANAGPDQTVDAGDAVTFDGSMSSDDAASPVLNYTWNATVGGVTVVLYEVHPTFVFQVAGNYTITLTVTDPGGLTSTDTVTITVNPANVAPVSRAGPDQTVKSGDLVIFDGSGSTDDAGTADLNYTWEFEYQDVVEVRYGPQPTFIFNETGTYGVTLTVRDIDGATSTDTVIITVEEKASKSFVSQYWWSIAIIAVAVVALVALLLMRRKGSGISTGESEEIEEKEPKKLVPPPDEEEL